MGSASSVVQIWNMALSECGSDTVLVTTSDRNRDAETCAIWWDTVRREALASDTWNFARTRVGLAADPVPPISRYQARYQLPADFIRFLTTQEDEEYSPWLNPDFNGYVTISGVLGYAVGDYKIEEGYLLIDSLDPLLISYIFDNQNVGQWSPEFVSYLVIKLASKIAYRVTNNQNLKQQLNSDAMKALPMAQTINGQQGKPTVVRRSNWLSARRGWW